MKHLLALMLVIGAMFGLLGQQTAAAASSVPVTVSAPVAAMSADCMEMMGVHQPQPAKKPCNGLTLDCIFATGCVVPLMREPATPASQMAIVVPQLYWTTTRVLAGTDLVPEPHPPSILG